MKKIQHTPRAIKSRLAILLTACLAGSPALALDYFHLGGANLRFDQAANYSNTNGSSTPATVAPGASDNLFFYNSLVAGPENRTFELGATNTTYNSLTFGSNAGTTQINRDAVGSNTTQILGIRAGGITVASGAGPVTFGAGSGTTGQRVDVAAFADYTVANNSSSDLTFFREFSGRGAAPLTVTVAGSGSGNTIFKDIRSYDAFRDLAITINKTSGTGVVIFDGANATNGHRSATTVTAGTLLVNGITGNTAGSSAFSVGANGVLGGSGTISGNLNLANGALLVFDTATTLTLGGTLTLDSTFGVGSLRNLSGGAINWSTIADNTYTLLNTSFVFNDTNISNFGLSNAYDIGGGRQAYFDNGSLALVVIPEPSTWALLAGSLVAIAVLRRRRK